ncbi:MAG: rhodanese-like domain-containing protein [Candidatus Velthaea sp.]
MSITVDELLSLGQNGATVINAGKHAGSREIRGAVRYRPADLLKADHLALPLAPDKPVVLYGERAESSELDELAGKLRSNGFADVRILTGGFAAYDDAGAPTQEASMEQTVPPTRPSEAQSLDRRV